MKGPPEQQQNLLQPKQHGLAIARQLAGFLGMNVINPRGERRMVLLAQRQAVRFAALGLLEAAQIGEGFAERRGMHKRRVEEQRGRRFGIVGIREGAMNRVAGDKKYVARSGIVKGLVNKKSALAAINVNKLVPVMKMVGKLVLRALRIPIDAFERKRCCSVEPFAIGIQGSSPHFTHLSA